MNRAYYSDTIENFLKSSNDEILGILAGNSEFADELTQKDAWKEENFKNYFITLLRFDLF
jgi:hypothetical protein